MDEQLSKRLSIRQGEDWISRLPDAILHHIFSFLPTVDAVRTTVLSSRWNRLWVSLTTLNFSEEDDSFSFQLTPLVNFVNNFFFLREAVDIHKFRLFTYETDWSHIKNWLTIAARRNVIHLELWVGSDPSLAVPSCFFSCKSLHRLKLEFFPETRLTLPSSACFPSLKFLHMIVSRDSHFDVMTKLLSTCPVLQELELEGHLDILPNLEFRIFSSTLTRLVIDICSDTNIIDDFKDCSFMISVPNLNYLAIHASIAARYSVLCPSFIVQVSLNVGYCDVSSNNLAAKYKSFTNLMNYHLHPVCALQLISEVSKARHLTLSADTMRILISAGKEDFPGFHDLTHLDIHLPKKALGLKLLLHFLRNSSRLQHLVLRQESIHKADSEKDLELTPWDILLDHPLLPLQIVEIKAFNGEDHELKLIKYLLKNALVLEKLTLWSTTSGVEKDAISRHVVSLPVASATCVIEFH